MLDLDLPVTLERAKLLAACVLCGVLGFLLGQLFTEPRVELREVVSTHVEGATHDKRAIVRTVYVRTTTTPDAGTVREESIREEEKSDTITTSVSDTKRETVTKLTDKPWRAGPLVGATWGAPPGSNPLVLGAEAAVTIPKTPIEVGAFALVPLYDPSKGVAGGSVTVRW